MAVLSEILSLLVPEMCALFTAASTKFHFLLGLIMRINSDRWSVHLRAQHCQTECEVIGLHPAVFRREALGRFS